MKPNNWIYQSYDKDQRMMPFCRADRMREIIHHAIEGVIRGDGTHRQKREAIVRYLGLLDNLGSDEFSTDGVIPF